jgi:hypothetical protein
MPLESNRQADLTQGGKFAICLTYVRLWVSLKPMNRLTPEERAKTLQLLCEGMSIRAITRVTGVSKNTVIKLLNDAGRALGAHQDEAFHNLNCKRVQVDEIWSFTYCKQRAVAGAKAAPLDAGDAWTWTAICADTKLVFSVLVGDRDAYFANAFMQDVASRLTQRVQLTSDGHKSYLNAVEGAFGADVDYAQLVKQYGPARARPVVIAPASAPAPAALPSRASPT